MRALTNSCAHVARNSQNFQRNDGGNVKESSKGERSHPAHRQASNCQNFQRPAGKACAFLTQGGGIMVSAGGTANLDGCNIHENTASGVGVCLFEPSRTFLPSPRWNRDESHTSFFQGGGLFIDSGGVANLDNCNIFENEAINVRARTLSWTFHPSPRWNIVSF